MLFCSDKFLEMKHFMTKGTKEVLSHDNHNDDRGKLIEMVLDFS